MAVPADIRAVPRPVNTVVENTGRPGPKQFIVRERAGYKYVKNGNPQPHNGSVIGYIYNGAFISIQKRCAGDGPDCLSYGSSAFVKSVSKDILDDLTAIFDINEALQIMSIATLRVIEPGITIKRYSTHYNRTFVSVHYPGIALSSNTVTSLLTRIGQDSSKRVSFFKRRIASVSESHHIVIDGTLIQDTSTVNSLSANTRKSRVKGCKEISIIYAYDVELSEPICAQVFPGNCIDASAYSTFVRTNNITEGIIVTDKGFPPSKIQGILEEHPKLHYLTPIKRNSKQIQEFSMYDYQGLIDNIEEEVLYKKHAIGDKKFLYAFRNVSKANNEHSTYLRRARLKHDFELDNYRKMESNFGTIVFESDLDLSPKTVYRCYADRWLLELVFKLYKRDENLDHTRIQSDYAVIGSEFVNFITTLITCRLAKIAEASGLLADMSFGDLLRELSQIWRKIDAPEEARSDDEYWVYPFKGALQDMEALGLSIPVPKPEPRKRGRPRTKPEFVGPKRPRGRPRKAPAS